MLSTAIQKKILLMAACGDSYRTIANSLHVGRTAVAKVAKRGYVMRPARRFSFHEKSRGRCPVCGVVVPLPCLACQIRRLQNDPPEAMETVDVESDAPDSLNLDLRGDDLARYLEIRNSRYALKNV